LPVIGFLRSTSLADATRLVTAFREDVGTRYPGMVIDGDVDEVRIEWTTS
jgi:hypothetical protein